MTAIMKPAGAPRGLRLDAMTPAAALRSAAGGCLMGVQIACARRECYLALRSASGSAPAGDGVQHMTPPGQLGILPERLRCLAWAVACAVYPPVTLSAAWKASSASPGVS